LGTGFGGAGGTMQGCTAQGAGRRSRAAIAKGPAVGDDKPF